MLIPPPAKAFCRLSAWKWGVHEKCLPPTAAMLSSHSILGKLTNTTQHPENPQMFFDHKPGCHKPSRSSLHRLLAETCGVALSWLTRSRPAATACRKSRHLQRGHCRSSLVRSSHAPAQEGAALLVSWSPSRSKLRAKSA